MGSLEFDVRTGPRYNLQLFFSAKKAVFRKCKDMREKGQVEKRTKCLLRKARQDEYPIYHSYKGDFSYVFEKDENGGITEAWTNVRDPRHRK